MNIYTFYRKRKRLFGVAKDFKHRQDDKLYSRLYVNSIMKDLPRDVRSNNYVHSLSNVPTHCPPIPWSHSSTGGFFFSKSLIR